MRLNKFLAQTTGMSRRAADKVIAEGRVLVNNRSAQMGQSVTSDDRVALDSQLITPDVKIATIMLNKPVGCVCSRDGQGSKTIYDLLPAEYHHLKPVGRLDKDSSGLLLLTNDGNLAHELTHPSFQKEKQYEVTLDRDLSEKDFQTITKGGVPLDDGPSKLGLDFINDRNDLCRVTMHEGRNRQIRRTFEALGYQVKKLHRTHFGPYRLDDLQTGSVRELVI